jgi:lipoate-protein ligase A
MWTVVAAWPGPPPAIETVHAAVLDPLAAALGAAGRPVVRRGSSDLAIDAAGGLRKVSGNALRIRRQAVLYHGTLLDDFDLSLVSRVLRHPPREPEYRAGRDHAAFLANLGLGRGPLEAAVRAAYEAGETRLDWPRDRVATLVRERYRDESWTQRLP